MASLVFNQFLTCTCDLTGVQHDESRVVDFLRHRLLRPMILRLLVICDIISDAGKNGPKHCGDATWEGISRSIARQGCGQPSAGFNSSRVPFSPIGRRRNASKIHHPERRHKAIQTDGDFRNGRFRSKRCITPARSLLYKDFYPQILRTRQKNTVICAQLCSAKPAAFVEEPQLA